MLARNLFGKGSRVQGLRAVTRTLASGIRNEATKGLELRPLYLDNQATTSVDPRVLDAMLPYYTERYGNPHSRSHFHGFEAEAAVENARAEIAALIGADPKEIVFTSGATESNNMAIKGITGFYAPKRNHVVTTLTEHKCVLDSCRNLEARGGKVTYLPVSTNGLVDLEELEASITPETAVVSVMFANNEIGVVQPVKEIGEICRRKKVFFHTDAAQAVGKIPVDVRDLKIDVMSISGHKIYGPKGVGALFVSRKPRVRLAALQSGGGQERGMRSGTVPTQLTVGLGAAARVAREELDRDHRRISEFADYFRAEIERRIPEVVFNGHPEHRIPGNVNVSFAHVEGESLLMGIKNVAVSSGSACTSASLEPSYVLRALGADEALAHSSIRFGIGRFTTREEIDYALDLLQREVERLRAMSPLWEMHLEGVDINSIQWTQDH